MIYMFDKKGFSLLSFLLYLTFFTIIMFFSCHIIVSLVIPTISTTRKCQSIVMHHIALDLFVRDIRAIRNNCCSWKVINDKELIWQIDTHAIGWSWTNDRLERKEGLYDQGWKKKTTSIVATKTKQAHFKVIKHLDAIVAIELTLVTLSQARPLICFVTIRK